MDDDRQAQTEARVSEVLEDLERLEDLAVDQHVAVFEVAHAKLRGLLTDQGHLPHQAPGATGA